MRAMRNVKKFVCGTLAAMLTLLCFTGCGDEEAEVNVAGKIYTYVGEDRSDFELDQFTISIFEDGTFTYYETLISSYIGFGEWSVQEDVLTLADNPDMCYPYVRYFKIDGDDLLFIEEGSHSFMFMDVKDGERFVGRVLSDEAKQGIIKVEE